MSISAPVQDLDITELNENSAFISADYTDPTPISGKKVSLFYNPETGLVEVEYSDITFEDLSPTQKIEALKAENEQLKADNELAQEAVIELYELIIGGVM